MLRHNFKPHSVITRQVASGMIRVDSCGVCMLPECPYPVFMQTYSGKMRTQQSGRILIRCDVTKPVLNGLSCGASGTACMKRLTWVQTCNANLDLPNQFQHRHVRWRQMVYEIVKLAPINVLYAAPPIADHHLPKIWPAFQMAHGTPPPAAAEVGSWSALEVEQPGPFRAGVTGWVLRNSTVFQLQAQSCEKHRQPRKRSTFKAGQMRLSECRLNSPTVHRSLRTLSSTNLTCAPFVTPKQALSRSCVEFCMESPPPSSVPETIGRKALKCNYRLQRIFPPLQPMRSRNLAFANSCLASSISCGSSGKPTAPKEKRATYIAWMFL